MYWKSDLRGMLMVLFVLDNAAPTERWGAGNGV